MPPHADALRVAIAGCHRMVSASPGSHNWASGFAGAPETRVVAVYDKGAGTPEEFRACRRDTWGDAPGYDDYDAMLEEVRPDIVRVATRQTYHRDRLRYTRLQRARRRARPHPRPGPHTADRLAPVGQRLGFRTRKEMNHARYIAGR